MIIFDENSGCIFLLISFFLALCHRYFYVIISVIGIALIHKLVTLSCYALRYSMGEPPH